MEEDDDVDIDNQEEEEEEEEEEQEEEEKEEKDKSKKEMLKINEKKEEPTLLLNEEKEKIDKSNLIQNLTTKNIKYNLPVLKNYNLFQEENSVSIFNNKIYKYGKNFRFYFK